MKARALRSTMTSWDFLVSYEPSALTLAIVFIIGSLPQKHRHNSSSGAEQNRTEPSVSDKYGSQHCCNPAEATTSRRKALLIRGWVKPHRQKSTLLRCLVARGLRFAGCSRKLANTESKQEIPPAYWCNKAYLCLNSIMNMPPAMEAI